MTNFIAEELPDDIQNLPHQRELRCPHIDERTGRVCNRLLVKGEASIKPQEFFCYRCKKKSTFQLVVPDADSG